MPFMKTLRSSFRPAASPGRGTDHVDRHSERPEELGEALGAGAGGERRRREAASRDDADQGDVRERARAAPPRARA